MSQDFIIVPGKAKIPTEKSEQIALILHQSVYNAFYRVFQSSDALRFADLSQFFTVTFGELLAHLLAHPDEFHAVLPVESPDGISVIRDGQRYTFREHYRSLVVHSELVEGIEAAARRWLHWHLRNQGLGKLLEHEA